ncbi:MAG TPA: CsbA family protein [Bacillaceae bacterium]
MIDKVLSAIFLPAVLVVFFTRVTYSRTVGFLLTVALIIVSAYNGYLHTWWLVVVDAASLTVGLYFANRMYGKRKKKNSVS